MRARALGFAAPSRIVTADPDLRLLADGEAVPAHAVAEGRIGFIVPAGTQSLRLVSRSFVPAGHHPYVDDWRRLGVAVSAIALHTHSGLHEVAPDHPALARGWHAVERQGALVWRWTSGNAVVPLACAEGGILEVCVHATGEYEVAETATHGKLAA